MPQLLIAKQKRFLSIIPLFMVILLDVAGIILVMPVLTPLILEANSGLVPANTPLLLRDFLYGLSMALFPLFMFFSTPILGDLSDHYGRKKILVLCLIISSISYLISAVAILYHSLLLLLFSRALAGLAAGTQPIATAAIIDSSAKENKTRNLAWVVFSSSIGLILGPMVGGITAEKSVAAWFSYETPFILAALVSFINVIFLYVSYKEKIPVRQQAATIQITKGFTLFMSAFLQDKFRLLAMLYFCFVLAWSLYYQTINWFFLAEYHYSVGQLGLFVAFIGVIFAFTSSIMMRIILKLFSHEAYAFSFFLAVMALANFGAAISHSELAQWLWVIFNAMGNIVCVTIAMSIFSNQVSPESQGWIMGVINSIAAITWTIGGMLAGPLGYINIHVPLWSAAILCVISFVLMLSYQKSHSNSIAEVIT